MVRLTRAQQQERTRAAVLAAAGKEFEELGYADARIDRIADRAELTRGAVYSNFPSKRALYLAVLLDLIERADATPANPATPPGVRPALAEAIGAFARVWLERLPLTGDSPSGGSVRMRSLAGVFDDEPGRTTLAQVTRLEAVLLGLALESCTPRRRGVRRVRLAELVLTMLHGAGYLAERAPGFGDPFDVVRASQHLARLDLGDTWAPAHLPHVGPARPADDSWQPPAGLPDQLTGQRVGLDGDGVLAVLGTRRLGAAEEAIRAARVGDQVTLAVVTGDPAETGRLVRLRISDLAACLRRVSTVDTRPGPRVVLDDGGALAAAVGVTADDDTEAAVRIAGGTIVARGQGRGAAHAVATASEAARSRGARR